MAAQSRLVFIHLGVADPQRSIRFFGALGFAFDEEFTDRSCACMILSEQAFVLFLTGASAAGAVVTVSAIDRDDVDRLADTALAHGGSPAEEPIDHGFMYGRSFHDLDGHHWEVMWTDPAVRSEPAPPAAGARGRCS